MNGACTNRGCINNLPVANAVTFKQMEYIQGMVSRLGKNIDDYDFKTMSMKDATKIIDILSKEISASEEELGND
jgi:pyruvate/2-oxoglutarate dehydrogenase complex dihydrolipoamide dehydrogenase (E3) component